jgi:F0F1-type ATP synthase membrane subunit b/b'
MYVTPMLVLGLLFQTPSPTVKPENPIVKNSEASNKAEYGTKAAPVIPPQAAVSTPVSQPTPTQQQNTHEGEPDNRVYRVDVVSQKFDWLYLIYVIATSIAAFVAWRALVAIKGQANLMNDQLTEMKEARKQTDKLIKAASDQVTEMKNAGMQTARLITTAEKSADAAKANAEVAREDVEMFINKERARLRVEVDALKLTPPINNMAHTVTYKILFYGFTDAFITSSAHYAVATKESTPHVDRDLIENLFEINIPRVITPSTAIMERSQFIFPEIKLKQPTIDGINQGMLFVHFFGFIKYSDVSGEKGKRDSAIRGKLTRIRL